MIYCGSIIEEAGRRSAALVLHTIHREMIHSSTFPYLLYLLPISGLLRLLLSVENSFSLFCVLPTYTHGGSRETRRKEPGGSLSLPCCSGSRRGVTHLCTFSLEILHSCTYTHTPYARITCLRLKQEATRSQERGRPAPEDKALSQRPEIE